MLLVIVVSFRPPEASAAAAAAAAASRNDNGIVVRLRLLLLCQVELDIVGAKASTLVGLVRRAEQLTLHVVAAARVVTAGQAHRGVEPVRQAERGAVHCDRRAIGKRRSFFECFPCV